METHIVAVAGQEEPNVSERPKIERQPRLLFYHDDAVRDFAVPLVAGEISSHVRNELPQMRFPVSVGNDDCQAFHLRVCVLNGSNWEPGRSCGRLARPGRLSYLAE